MNKRIKIAVVGIGLMGSQHLKALQLSRRAILHSIVDLNRNSRIYAEKFKVPFYNDTTELLKNNKPDAVIVATPNQFHEKHTISFLNAKIPVTLEPDDVQAIMSGTGKQNGVLQYSKENFIHSFLSSVRQKMLSKRK